MKKRLEKIYCPFCNAEYLPAEIFYPNSFLGKPKNIIKDKNGIIEHFEKRSMNPFETYICDFCKKSFVVNAKVSFEAKKDKIGNITNEYVSTISEGFTLEE